MNILLDPGHGGPDPGACANGMREADYVLDSARYLMHYLQSLGHVVYLTRPSDCALGHTKADDLAARCAVEQSCSPDLFVSLHCNAAVATTGHGFEVWTAPGQTRSDKAAEQILRAFERAFPLRAIRRDLADGDGDKESTFRVLVGTIGPAVLVEMGFLTNPEDAGWLRANQIQIVKALAEGIVASEAELAA